MSLAFEQSSFGERQMQFRDHPAVQGKRDMYPVDPRKLKVDDAYNVRDMQAKETRDHVAWLKASIIAGGVHTPLEVRLDGKNIFVVAGHCRLAAVLEAIGEGHEIKTVPCIPEPKGTDEIDRTVNLVISNSGKPLAPLEMAKVVKRLDGYGWSAKQIAERLGWKSVNSVKQHLEMLALPEPVKQHIRAGTVSATTARHLAKSDLTPEQQEELIRANEEQNRRIKGKRTRVTPTQVRAATKPKPPSAPVPAPAEPPPTPSPAPAEAQTEPQSAPEPAGAAETVSLVGGGSFTVPGVAPLVDQPTGGYIARQDEIEHAANAQPLPAQSAEQPASSIGPADYTSVDAQAAAFMPARSQSVKDLIDALAPFAQILNDVNINQYGDDETIMVSVKHLKRAWEVWWKATGDDVKDAA